KRILTLLATLVFASSFACAQTETPVTGAGGLVAPADSISLDTNSSDNFIRIRGNGSCDTPVNSGVNNTIQDQNKILYSFGAPLVPHNYTVSTLPSASSDSGAIVRVTDSTAVATEGQTCVGSSTNVALAFSTGSAWKCF
ncbi:MAG: hypothetical protein KGI66_01065, partial [Patescibacteria group bacterium]|nr:hypothetical protein [Patescibacteria group bacterium]